MARKPSWQTGTPGPRVKQTPMIDAGRMVMSNGEPRYVRTSISYLYTLPTATIVIEDDERNSSCCSGNSCGGSSSSGFEG